MVDQICKLAKKGATPSQIGVVLRDSHGIAQVKVVTGTLNPYAQTSHIVESDTDLLQATRFSEFLSPMVRSHDMYPTIIGSNPMMSATKKQYASAWSLTDGVIITGLAPEIPEDLYMLIKKVCFVHHLLTGFMLIRS